MFPAEVERALEEGAEQFRGRRSIGGELDGEPGKRFVALTPHTPPIRTRKPSSSWSTLMPTAGLVPAWASSISRKTMIARADRTLAREDAERLEALLFDC